MATAMTPPIQKSRSLAAVSASSPLKGDIQTPRPPAPPPPAPPSDSDVVVHIPSYSRWFSWNNIHECEVRFLPEFFDSRSSSKNPTFYLYIRNSIIKHARLNPSSKITFTEVRKTLVGDVGSIRRVFDFLEAWGLVNYTPSALNRPLKWDDSKDSKSSPQTSSASAAADGASGASSTGAAPPPNRDSTKRICSGCKSVCSIACFACDKYDLTLCARCYVRGSYQVGVSSSDFRRVEISEEIKTDWTEKETLQLLEAIMHYNDDWKRVAQHVTGRSEKDCVTHFLKLPFGEEFSGYTDAGDADSKYNQIADSTDAGDCGPDSKRMRLTPLADASNPIMAQAAFLSALAGADVAEAAAQAAVSTLTEVDYGANKSSFGSLSGNTRQQDANTVTRGDTHLNALDKACIDASTLLEKEEVDLERAISRITEVQMKEIQDKIIHFEELDLQMEKEWQQLEQMKNLLFVDQLSLLFHKSSTQRKMERAEENVKTE